jgi:hypothetical protein
LIPKDGVAFFRKMNSDLIAATRLKIDRHKCAVGKPCKNPEVGNGQLACRGRFLVEGLIGFKERADLSLVGLEVSCNNSKVFPLGLMGSKLLNK